MTVAPTVLFIHSSAGGYGADRQLRVLVEGLDRARFAPLVVLPEEGELAAPLREAGIPIHIEPLAVLRRDHLRGRSLVDTIARYRRNVRVLGALARAHRARIVHSNTSLVLCGQAVADHAGAAHVISVREIYEQTGGRAGALALAGAAAKPPPSRRPRVCLAGVREPIRGLRAGVRPA